MKKKLILSICTIFICMASGCTPGSVLDRYLSTGDEPVRDSAAEQPRVYMDELQGTILDFDGSRLTLLSQDVSYEFDVSQASVECKNGIITGDEVSVIYEGQLSGSDTSGLKVLKVADEMHRKSSLKDRTARGQILSLTPNTVTLRSRSGKTAVYPITGAEQYYQSGIKEGSWVYLHFKGEFSDSEENPDVLDASHLKVFSISDVDPIRIPEPTPTPSPEEAVDPSQAEKQFRGVIQDLSMHTLTLLPDGAQQPVTVDLSAVPAYFKGGAAPGSSVNVTYTGEFNGTTLEGITILGVTGEDPDALREGESSFTVSGTIVGSTANTATISTSDGALVTCTTQNVENASTQGMFSGVSIRVAFDPVQSRDTNIYTSVKIEDA